MFRYCLILLSIGWLQCAANQPPVDMPEITTAFTLTSQNPSTEVILPKTLFQERPALLELKVQEIQNPEVQSFTITTHIFCKEDGQFVGQSQLLGVITPFPANQSGNFLLSLEKVWPAFEQIDFISSELIFELEITALEGNLREDIKVTGLIEWK